MSSAILLLLSGGMDSTTCLWWIRRHRTEEIHTLSIDYHQRHRIELESAAQVAERSGVRTHQQIEIDLAQIGGSPLTDESRHLPTAREHRQAATVVPFRNLLFVTAAAACAEVLGIGDIYISPVRDDYRSYRDCRREFYDSLEETLRLGAGEQRDIQLHTPFVDKWKTEVLALGLELGVPYELTHTCYTGRRPACGECDACAERIAAFRACETADPLKYEIDIDWTETGAPSG